MALVNCNECDSQISDQAKSCPKCGITLKQDDIYLQSVNKLNFDFLSMDNLKEIFKLSFYFSSKGKTNRSQYFFSIIIFSIVIGIIMSIIDYKLSSISDVLDGYARTYSSISSIIFQRKLFIFINISVKIYIIYFMSISAIKRCRDMGESQYYWLKSFIPFYNIYIGLRMFFVKSSKDMNKLESL